MALNLGAMIQAARSQRNPLGEFIANAQTQQLMNKSNGQPTQNTQQGGQVPAGLMEILKKYLPFGGQ